MSAAPTLLPGPAPADTSCLARRDSTGSGHHTPDTGADVPAPAPESADTAKTKGLPNMTSACVGADPQPTSSPGPALGEVSLESPGPKPSSRQAKGARSSSCPAPKPQPKPKSRKEPEPSSQPKLAQFFVAQTRKANTSSEPRQDRSATLAPTHPKPSPCPSQPALPPPVPVAACLGPSSHGGESRKGARKRKGKGSQCWLPPFQGQRKRPAQGWQGQRAREGYQVYLSGRRPDQSRVSRANVRSDSTIRAEVRNRMQAVHNAPIAGAKPAAVAAP